MTGFNRCEWGGSGMDISDLENETLARQQEEQEQDDRNRYGHPDDDLSAAEIDRCHLDEASDSAPLHEEDRYVDQYPDDPWANEYPPAPDNKVVIAGSLNYENGIETKQYVRVIEGKTVTTRSELGTTTDEKGLPVYRDQIVTDILTVERPWETAARVVSDLKELLVQGFRHGNWDMNRQYPTEIALKAISHNIYGQSGFPDASTSPEDTVGYELIVSRGTFHFGGPDTPMPCAQLLFPKTRSEAEVLHSNAVVYIEQGLELSEVIQRVKDDAAKMGVMTYKHGFLPE